MTSAQTGINMPLASFLRLIMGYLALQTPDRRVYLKGSKAEVYNFMHDVCKEFCTDFEPFSRMHFYTGGAHWYSVELYGALWVLFESGHFSQRGGDDYVSISWHPDSENFINQRLQELYDGDEYRKKRFAELAERFRTIIKTHKEVVDADLPF